MIQKLIENGEVRIKISNFSVLFFEKIISILQRFPFELTIDDCYLVVRIMPVEII